MVQSRTAKSIKNSIIATLFYIVNLGLQFFSRKIFLDYLGTEILGLNTTAMNLLQFLNLAELGISAAVGFTLYKPIHDNDHITINEIVTLQGHLYRRIAYIIIIGAIILMFFFPIIFNKITLPLWYAYGSFGVLLFSALLGYFFNYRQIVLSANQQDYKITYSYKSVMLVKVLFQMMAVYYFPNGYLWWLVFEVIFAIIATITLTWMTNKALPYLSNTKHSFKELRLKYPEFTTKIKQIFFHKIGLFALTQSSPLIIYAFTTLSVVALYGNYMVIINGIAALFTAIFNSFNAGIGNLIAENNTSKNLSVFEELFSLRFFLVTCICFITWLTIQSFISIWIGHEYQLPNSTALLIVLLLYVSISRYSIDSFINGFGLFNDILAPIIESILNIGLSILLGYHWGLNGILSGVLISQILVIKIWKPYFLFKNGFKGYMFRYLKLIIKHILCFTIAFIIFSQINKNIPHLTGDGVTEFVTNLAISLVLFGSILIGLQILLNTQIKEFFKRLSQHIFN